jgi:glycosyltransferase involved in cell wall biosynthesis
MKKDARRIGFIFNTPFFLGGGEHSLFLLIESLMHSDFEPVGIVPGKGEIGERLEIRGIASTICPLNSLRSGTRKFFFRDLKTLIGAAKDCGIKIIHANGSRACLYGGIAGRLLGIPVVWHVRETIRDHLAYDGLLGFLAARIVCASHAIVHERFAPFGLLFSRKTTVVYNGVVLDQLQRDEEKRYVIRTELGIEEADVLIGMVGNFIPLKGHKFVIKGIAEACKSHPGFRVKLLCVGRVLDAGYHRGILALAKEEGLEDRIIFMDYSTDIRGILSAADVFTLPSKREGFSRSLLEAMGMGLPVIATNIPAIAEAVEDQSGGILVDDGDVDAMAAAILKLCQEPDLRERMGRRNRERVMKHFTMDIHRKEIENVYFVLLAR